MNQSFSQPRILLFLALVLVLSGACRSGQNKEQNWTHYVRIAGHPLSLDNVDDIIESATQTHVFGIETDNDIPGRYPSFLNPDEKLKAIRLVTERAHQQDNHTFVYIAGLECITPNADNSEHSFYKDHPDWVQQDITGRPAIFGGEDAFWIVEGDEDVWITPYAKEWRQVYMEHVRNIAATGIDGIYVDIPYWMTHFEGWWDTWASFDDYTVDAFKQQTGLDARQDLELGNFDDPRFRKWVDFRIETITDFMREIDENVKSVNPGCMTIAEIYPGIGEDAVRVGADVYQLYEVVDAIGHEYSEGGYTAAARDPIDWFAYMTGMYTFRAFAEGKASWMLSYSWDEEQGIDPREAMKTMFMSHLMAGTNTWDAQGHIMSRSNDYETRAEVYHWIADHEETFYLPREPIEPLGIYFSPSTRNYFTSDYIPAFKGMMYLALQSHREFQVVTPRTLASFRGGVLVLPDVRCVSDKEIDELEVFLDNGGAMVITGASGEYTEWGEKRKSNRLLGSISLNDRSPKAVSTDGPSFIYYPECPGKTYFHETHRNFNGAAVSGRYRETGFHEISRNFFADLRETIAYEPDILIDAPPFVSTQIARVNGRLHIFLANFTGIKGNERIVPEPVPGVEVRFPSSEGHRVYLLPYLGEVAELSVDQVEDTIACTIPEIKRGVVLWVE